MSFLTAIDATETLKQIGRARLVRLGIRTFQYGSDYIQFFVKGPRTGKHKIRIQLDPNDTYNVSLWHIESARAVCDLVEHATGVGCENLGRTVEEFTFGGN